MKYHSACEFWLGLGRGDCCFSTLSSKASKKPCRHDTQRPFSNVCLSSQLLTANIKMAAESEKWCEKRRFYYLNRPQIHLLVAAPNSTPHDLVVYQKATFFGDLQSLNSKVMFPLYTLAAALLGEDTLIPHAVLLELKKHATPEHGCIGFHNTRTSFLCNTVDHYTINQAAAIPAIANIYSDLAEAGVFGLTPAVVEELRMMGHAAPLPAGEVQRHLERLCQILPKSTGYNEPDLTRSRPSQSGLELQPLPLARLGYSARDVLSATSVVIQEKSIDGGPSSEWPEIVARLHSVVATSAELWAAEAAAQVGLSVKKKVVKGFTRDRKRGGSRAAPIFVADTGTPEAVPAETVAAFTPFSRIDDATQTGFHLDLPAAPPSFPASPVSTPEPFPALQGLGSPPPSSPARPDLLAQLKHGVFEFSQACTTPLFQHVTASTRTSPAVWDGLYSQPHTPVPTRQHVRKTRRVEPAETAQQFDELAVHQTYANASAPSSGFPGTGHGDLQAYNTLPPASTLFNHPQSPFATYHGVLQPDDVSLQSPIDDLLRLLDTPISNPGLTTEFAFRSPPCGAAAASPPSLSFLNAQFFDHEYHSDDVPDDDAGDQFMGDYQYGNGGDVVLDQPMECDDLSWSQGDPHSQHFYRGFAA
eukprot:m.22597 g.22597  ORF g.22597 m.22597 type:complete len:644 (+) comp8329_c0_seq1:155-2086(+)